MTASTSAHTTAVAAVEGHPLTVEDVAALRTCESLGFHYRKGKSYILAALDTVVSTRTYTAREQRLFPDTRNVGHGDRGRVIPATGSIYAYGETGGSGWTHRTYPAASCFASIHSALHSPLWPTTASLIRPGDRLHLGWTANNDTELLRQNGLHQDYLHLTVTRGQRELTFAVTDQVSDSYSPARMIRRHG